MNIKHLGKKWRKNIIYKLIFRFDSFCGSNSNQHQHQHQCQRTYVIHKVFTVPLQTKRTHVFRLSDTKRGKKLLNTCNGKCRVETLKMGNKHDRLQNKKYKSISICLFVSLFIWLDVGYLHDDDCTILCEHFERTNRWFTHAPELEAKNNKKMLGFTLLLRSDLNGLF